MKTKKETPERILIYQDEDLHKYNKKVLDEIFSDIQTMKSRFSEIEVPFNQANFIKTMQEGSNWIEQTLFDKLAANYKGLAETIIESMVPREQFRKFLVPIDEIVERVKGSLKDIDLQADQLPFDAKHNPVINAELKEILSEASKRYATGTEEIELYYAILKFIESTNALEACLAKNQYPLLFTQFTSSQAQVRYAESENFAFPLCLADYDNIDRDGFAKLTLNPEVFSEYELKRNAANFFTENAGQSSEINSFENRSSEIPAAGFNPTGKAIENKIPAKHWSGMAGVD